MIPKYILGDLETEKELSPMKKTIFKTMEVTETFTAYDVLKYVASMDKAIADKEGELKGLRDMREAYMKELKLIEKKLGLKNLEKEYIKEQAKEARENNKANKESNS